MKFSYLLSMNISILYRHSHALSAAEDNELAVLLDRCFPDTFDGRSYFKQLPHSRFLAYDEDKRLVGQVGLDHRVIRVGNQVMPILGLIDLCVCSESRGQGIGSRLLAEAEQLAIESSATIDFLLLVTDVPAFYKARGYQRVPATNARWLAIEDRRSHSIMCHVETELVCKPLRNQSWPDGPIDLLGYLF